MSPAKAILGVVRRQCVGGRFVIRHTVIEAEYRGSGLGTELVRWVLDDLVECGNNAHEPLRGVWTGFAESTVIDWLARTGQVSSSC